MRIHDRRPWPERLLGGATPGAAPDNSGVRYWSEVTGLVPDLVSAIRAWRRPAPPAGTFVVSVGNLSLGGTGKTPVVAAIALALADQGMTGSVLTRGYRSEETGPLVVEPGNLRAGDEARLLAGLLQQARWPVVQSRNRPRGLSFILERLGNLDVVLLEDAHQTRGIGRHLDVLILDRWTCRGPTTNGRLEASTGPVFPFGPWRESARGAARAGVWVLEAKENGLLEGPEGIQVTSFERLETLVNPRTGKLSDVPGGKWAMVSGIARPANFERRMSDHLGEELVLSVRCGDHARYSPADVELFRGQGRREGVDGFITTAKDWVKLGGIWPRDLPVLVATLEVRWTSTPTLPELIGERLASHREGV